jgi:LEA14-like dessication related protein
MRLFWPITVKVKGSPAKEHQAIDHQTIEHLKAKTSKIVENKAYFIKHVKLYN